MEGLHDVVRLAATGCDNLTNGDWVQHPLHRSDDVFGTSLTFKESITTPHASSRKPAFVGVAEDNTKVDKTNLKRVISSPLSCSDAQQLAHEYAVPVAGLLQCREIPRFHCVVAFPWQLK